LFRLVVLALAFLLIPGVSWAVVHSDGEHGGAGKIAHKASPKKAVPNRPKQTNRSKKSGRYAPVELYEINTKEILKLRFYDNRGRPIRSWKKRFDRFMRCHQTGAVFKMDVRLAHMLYEVGRHYDGHRLEVVSGYRHPKVAKNPKSPHKKGLACDFRVRGVANAALRDYLRKTFAHAGVGYYPNSVFVHMDDRKKGPSAFWIDYAGPGQAASYAENPRDDLRTGRAERTHAPSSGPAARSEGEDDMALAGAAFAGPRDTAGAALHPGKKPVEVKTPSDTFGD